MKKKNKKSYEAVDMSEIKTLFGLKEKVTVQAKSNKDWGHELSLKEFAIAMGCLLPAAYGPRIARRFSEELGFSPSNDRNRGDCYRDKSYTEIKGSIITLSNNQLNLVQIRPWQDVGYFIYCFDLRDTDNVNISLFSLTKQQMEQEMKLCGTTSAHGTALANADNANKELALRIDVDGLDFARWTDKYSTSIELF